MNIGLGEESCGGRMVGNVEYLQNNVKPAHNKTNDDKLSLKSMGN
jgi:hypothetical protein